ncbi:MAG: hypothetical protein GF309_13735 [Candidatus Lokiarchaeota archaeon]|nr:hypothetical protein [Candidatus Lokiarchaeota archaeon]
MVKIFESLSGQKWSAITLQVSILAANVYFLLNQDTHLFFGLSVILVLSLFCLQIVSRRFLLFYPVRRDFQVPTPMFDTYVLRVFIILAILFLVLGFVHSSSTCFSPSVSLVLSIVAVVLLVIFPILWMVFGNRLITKGIFQKIKGKRVKQIQLCPLSSDNDRHYRVKIKELVSAESARIIIKCDECGKEIKDEPLILGY